MNSTFLRTCAPVIGAVVLGGVAVTAVPASAATADSTATAVPATVVTSKVVPASQITKYHLTKKQLRDIETAKKFANTKKAKQVRFRESRHNYKVRSGQYTGAWQFDGQTWRSNGGKQFSSEAYKAPKWAQDYIMWRTHKSRGWQPWGG